MSVDLDYRRKFRRLMDRMATACGVYKLTDDMADDYYLDLKAFEIDTLEQAITNLVRSKDGAFHSLLSSGEIISEARAVEGKSGRKQTIIPTWCEACHNTGLRVVAIAGQQPATYRCECANGDRHWKNIKPYTEIASQVPEPPPPAKLTLLTLADIEAMAPDQELAGAELSLICAFCGKPYDVRIERRTTGRELRKDYFERKRPYQCGPCFVDEGRRRGCWV